MLKKWIAFLLTTVLVMALCPTVTMAENTNNWDMEVWSEPNQPDGFTITPGEGAVVTCDETNILGNTSKKIKISHPEETANTETETTIAFSIDQENVSSTTMSAGYYISFWLDSLTEESEGVKFVRDYQETEFFKDTTYQKWRKMMTYTLGNVQKKPFFVITFKGVGTVYLDDFEREITQTIVNGGVEGLVGDGKLAGYKNNTAVLQTQFWDAKSEIKTIKSGELSKDLAAGFYFVETNENNYLLAVNTIEYFEFRSTTTPGLIDGQSYRASISNKSSNIKNGCKLNTWTGFALPTAGSTSGIFASPTLDWEDKSITFLYKYGRSQGQVAFDLYASNKTVVNATDPSQSDTNPFCYFDNLRLEKITEKAVLKNADGEIIPSLIPGKPFKVYYEAPLFDKDKDAFENAKVDGYMTEKKITAVAVLYKLEGGVKTIEGLELVQNLAGKSDNGQPWPDSPPETNEIGFRPAHYEFNFDSLPETGEYIVKVFAWSDLDGLTPFSASSYSFSTASK